jgi:hypothetical protein
MGWHGGNMNRMEMLKIVEEYSRKTERAAGSIKVTRVPNSITVYVETIGENGRSIFFDEYKVDGKTYWAGYSSRSDTVFVSQQG